MVDDLGPEWISCYGARGIETPNVDALAAGGMRFQNAYSMPKCTPTRVTLLTGQYPFRHGWVNHWDVPRWGAGCHFDPEEYTTFAELLRSAGYATGAAGKWQVNDFRVQPDAMAQHGFDEWCMWTGYETGVEASAKRYWDPYLNTPEGSRTHEGRFGTDVFVEFLIGFMEDHRDEPWLLYFPMALTHGPLVPTPDEPEAESPLDRHRAMVRYVDRAVGRLVAALDQLGLREDTIVLFTTDNGTSRGLTGDLGGREVPGGKGRLSESGCRAPLVVNGPGRVSTGVVTEALVDLSDVLPTFAELAGAPPPEDLELDGRSFAPLLLGAAQDSPRSWILAMGGGTARRTAAGVVGARPYADRVLRDRRYKLWIEDGAPTRLFDLRADPGETANLIASEEAGVKAAKEHLEAAWHGFPERDASPRYTPTPAQPWDVPIRSEGSDGGRP